MAFTEPPSVRYEIINGKKVPVVECETEVVLRNKKTGYEYSSDKRQRMILQTQIQIL